MPSATGDATAAGLDVVLRSAEGTTPLATAAELRSDLAKRRLTGIEERRLPPHNALLAIVAT